MSSGGEAAKVSRWVAQAKQNAKPVKRSPKWGEAAQAAAQAEAEQLREELRSTLVNDIQAQIKADAARRKAEATEAAQRLYKDAQRRCNVREATEKSSVSAVSAGPVAAACSAERFTSPAQTAKLLEDLASKKKAEVDSLNLKRGVRPKPLLYQIGKEAAPPPAKSYQQLLYEEGMLSREERHKWEEEGRMLLSAFEVQQCTFKPELNKYSRELTASHRVPLSERAADVLDERRARRQWLRDETARFEKQELPFRPTPSRPPPHSAGRAHEPSSRDRVPIHESLLDRGYEAKLNMQQLRADFEKQDRAGESFSPSITEHASHASAAATPVYARLYAQRTPSAMASRGGVESARQPTPTKTSARQQAAHAPKALSERLYAEASAHAQRVEFARAAARREAKRSASAPKMCANSQLLVLRKGARELAALFNSLGLDEKQSLSASQLHAVLHACGIVASTAAAARGGGDGGGGDGGGGDGGRSDGGRGDGGRGDGGRGDGGRSDGGRGDGGRGDGGGARGGDEGGSSGGDHRSDGGCDDGGDGDRNGGRKFAAASNDTVMFDEEHVVIPFAKDTIESAMDSHLAGSPSLPVSPLKLPLPPPPVDTPSPTPRGALPSPSEMRSVSSPEERAANETLLVNELHSALTNCGEEVLNFKALARFLLSTDPDQFGVSPRRMLAEAAKSTKLNGSVASTHVGTNGVSSPVANGVSSPLANGVSTPGSGGQAPNAHSAAASGGDVDCTPRGNRSGRQVFEDLYRRASESRQRLEMMRVHRLEEEMQQCTFSPDLSKEHPTTSRWERMQKFGRAGA